jgi:hypothetical protein
MLSHIRHAGISLLILSVLSLAVSSCTAPTGRQPLGQPSARSGVLGMTMQGVRSCAGSPLDELKLKDDVTVLRYYKEAAMLEESQVGSKGSIPGVHRGCWTNLLIEKGKVTGVEFRPVPDQERDPFLCHQMFEGCAQ